jgi:hypothetical protein
VNVTGNVTKTRGLKIVSHQFMDHAEERRAAARAMSDPKEQWIDSGVRPEKPLG